MSQGDQMTRECEARLRDLVPKGEEVVATGTADEFPEPKGDLGVQGDWRLLLITEKRILMADWSKPEAAHEEILFKDIGRWGDGQQYHRYVMTLDHPPAPISHGSKTSLLRRWFRKDELRAETRKTLRFSHRDSKAALALRAALERRATPHEDLVLSETSRAERTAGNTATLQSGE